ncbi:MAG: bifunctional diaminohydroxyphosphoribosylaminopyrimidine deaminase/5-amino-6-(5-phosphoribosylamino)uracil reductase RibD [Bacteroidetes bacterium]|nr:bifunctional diaminohydroxyphosphoribosylaminopyrimidine deaminase/5-amino-6-(5-phosphoribosylamino)uracil reductase RibD [Bacteroidota bacterium]
MTDESYIKIAIELAKKGKGNVSPGPLSGFLFVKRGKIIGAGFNSGEANCFAELNILQRTKEQLKGSTLYSNLESNPGSDNLQAYIKQLVSNEIARVVFGTLNPDPCVNGKVIQELMMAGIETRVGILESECAELNKIYFKFVSEKKPFITLKIAMTLDGKIADPSGNSKWITCLDSRCFVHELRSNNDAVLVGRNTVENDNPELNVRLVEGRDPKRIILDSKLKLNLQSKIFQMENKNTILITSSEFYKSKKKKVEKMLEMGVTVISIPLNSLGEIGIKRLINKLAALNISSILVEGGSKIFSSFIKAKMFDELLVFISPRLLGTGLPAIEQIGLNTMQSSMKLKYKNVQQIGEDVLLTLHR